jgi:hypothetical protein
MIKANWGRLYERWHFIWQEVRYGGGGPGDLSDLRTIEDHSHYRLARRCLTHLPRLFWSAGPRPPGYLADMIGKLNAAKAERGRLNKPGADAERDLARRSSNQVEQVEEWSFVFTALLEMATAPTTRPPLVKSREGGDAYDLKKRP